MASLPLVTVWTISQELINILKLHVYYNKMFSGGIIFHQLIELFDVICIEYYY